MPLKKATQAVISPNICTTDTNQTISGVKTFSQPITGSITGNVTGNLTGNVTGNITGNVSGSAGSCTGNSYTASSLNPGKTIQIGGAVTGTPTLFNGSTNITIPSTISSGATITSPVFAGTATGSIPSKIIQGVTDGISATPGYIGELITSTSALQSINSNQLKKGAFITLTAGEWEVYGNTTLNFTSVTCVAGDQIGAGISIDSESLVTNQVQLLLIPALSLYNASPAYAFVTPRIRVSVTSPNKVINLMVQAPTFSVGSINFTSIISANRVR